MLSLFRLLPAAALSVAIALCLSSSSPSPSSSGVLSVSASPHSSAASEVALNINSRHRLRFPSRSQSRSRSHRDEESDDIDEDSDRSVELQRVIRRLEQLVDNVETIEERDERERDGDDAESESADAEAEADTAESSAALFNSKTPSSRSKPSKPAKKSIFWPSKAEKAKKAEEAKAAAEQEEAAAIPSSAELLQVARQVFTGPLNETECQHVYAERCELVPSREWSTATVKHLATRVRDPASFAGTNCDALKVTECAWEQGYIDHPGMGDNGNTATTRAFFYRGYIDCEMAKGKFDAADDRALTPKQHQMKSEGLYYPKVDRIGGIQLSCKVDAAGRATYPRLKEFKQAALDMAELAKDLALLPVDIAALVGITAARVGIVGAAVAANMLMPGN